MTEYSRIASPYGGPGRYTNPGMVALLSTYAAIKGIRLKDIYCIQGSFNVGVKASAGTHDKADCLDVKYGFDEHVLKRIGGFGWPRTPAEGFSYHFHLGRQFSSAMAWLATAQDKAYRASAANGLGNLTHRDNGYTPYHRSVYHLEGPTSKKFVAIKDTNGYSEAGFTGADIKANSKLEKFVKTTRQKGFLLYNIAGRVRCEGHEYWVTDSGTFYNAANFKAYVPGTTTPTKPTPVNTIDVTTATQNVIVNRLSPKDPPRIGDWKKGASWPSRIPILTNALKAYNPSIVTTQEQGTKDNANQFANGLQRALGGPWGNVNYGDGWDISEAVFHNGDYTQVAGGYIKVTPTGPGSSHATWPFAHLRHDASGIEFFVVSVHTIAGSGLTLSRQREKQILNGVPQMEKIAGKLPIIWQGDFNNAKGDLYDGVGRAFKKLGYVDVEDTPCPAVNPTRPSYNGLSAKPGTSGKQLDRCFFKPANVSARRRVVNVQWAEPGKVYATPLGSDHWGVVFDLTIRRA